MLIWLPSACSFGWPHMSARLPAGALAWLPKQCSFCCLQHVRLECSRWMLVWQMERSLGCQNNARLVAFNMLVWLAVNMLAWLPERSLGCQNNARLAAFNMIVLLAADECSLGCRNARLAVKNNVRLVVFNMLIWLAADECSFSCWSARLAATPMLVWLPSTCSFG